MAEVKNYFRVLVESVDTIIIIKKLTPNELEKIYNILRHKVTNNNTVSVMDYHKMLITATMKNPGKFFNTIAKKPKAGATVQKVYDTIVAFYPMLSIFNICVDINTDEILTSHDAEVLQGRFDEEMKAELASMTSEKLIIQGKEDIKRIHKFFLKNIVGQKEAIESTINCVKLITSKLAKSSSMFFVGPTGVGKTELAKLLGEKYCGNFFKVNCAEYASAHEYSKLIGSPPGYVGHSDKSILAQKAEVSNKWVFLFDEIEKANDRFFDFLLALLDTGIVCDNQGRALDFSESIFIFTSNQGSSDIRLGTPVGFGGEEKTYEKSLDEVRDSVTNKFSPEFINRIDSFVFFNQLTKEDAAAIAKLNLGKLPIIATDSLVEYIVDKAFSVKYGARAIRRFIKTDLMVKLADKILDDGVIVKGRKYTMDFVNGEITIQLHEAAASGA